MLDIGARVGYTPADTKDLGSAISSVARNLINNSVNAPFLARVMTIKGNKVDVQALDLYSFEDIPQPPLIFNNLLVALPMTGKTATTLPIQVGDVGLCLITDKDLSMYKKTGQGGIPPSKRRFNKIDSVFMPLSLYNQEPILQDFIFKYFAAPKQETVLLKISGQQAIELAGGNKGDKYKITIDDTGKLSIIINNENKIELTAEGALSVTAKGDLNITINNTNKIDLTKDGAFTMEIDKGLTIKSKDALNLEMTKDMTLKGQNVTIEAQQQMTLKAGKEIVIKPDSITIGDVLKVM